MRPIFTLFVSFLLFASPMQAQQDWFWQNPLPQGNDFLGSTSPDSNTIIMVGRGGAVVVSKDGGDTWTWRKTGLRQELYAVTAVGNTAFAVGSDGTIIRSFDCGETWSQLNSGRNDTLRGIHAINAQLIIAVGDTGTILRSSDGGDNWVYQPFPGLKSNLNDVFFPTPDFGVIVGDSFPPIGGPPIIQSEDSGVSWSPFGGGAPSLNGASINSVWVPKADPNKAVLVGEEGLIINTHNGGLSWNAPLTGTTVPIQDVWFFDDQNGFATGPGGVLLRTKDCGDSWSVVPTPDQRDLLTVIFPKDSTAIFGGNVGAIIRSPDGGNTFENLQSGFFPNLSSVSFLDDSFGIAAGELGSVLRTTDAGQSWNPLFPPITFDPIESVTTTRQGELKKDFWMAGGVFGGIGRIWHSGDSGVSWQPQPVAALSKFFDIAFLDSLKGFAVGLNGIVYCTSNGGLTWTPKNSGSSEWLLGVTTTNDSTAYIAGGFGTMLRTRDFGNTWQPLPTNTQEWLTSVSFMDDSFGIATGNHGLILRTRDAGDSWEDISPPDNCCDFTDVALFRGKTARNGRQSEGIGITAVGYGGTIFYSKDGGDSWIQQSSHTFNPILATHFTDSATGTAVGFFGTILRTNTVGPLLSQHESIKAEDIGYGPLEGVFPNPFREELNIPFQLPNPMYVELNVVDLQGRVLVRIAQGELTAGQHDYRWRPTGVSAGIYLVRLQMGHRTFYRKVEFAR